jgi:hypothetical protein
MNIFNARHQEICFNLNVLYAELITELTVLTGIQ